MKRYRPDKSPAEADTIDDVRVADWTGLIDGFRFNTKPAATISPKPTPNEIETATRAATTGTLYGTCE